MFFALFLYNESVMISSLTYNPKSEKVGTVWILFLECVAGLNDRKGCIFTNDMKLARQNMKYFVFILSAMKYKSK